MSLRSKCAISLWAIVVNLLLGAGTTPQYYVPPNDSPFASTGSGIGLRPSSTSWSNYNRYGVSPPRNPVHYYPSSLDAQPTLFAQAPSPGFYPQHPGPGPAFDLTPAALDAVLARPLLVIDSQVFAMYQLIKCWEQNGDLKKCVKLVEKVDKLFKKAEDDDEDKKKGKGKMGKGKKSKKKNKKNPDAESADSQEEDQDEARDNEDGQGDDYDDDERR